MAKTINVSPNDDLQTVLDNASDGDIIVLASGKYKGNFIINSAIKLTGTKDAILDGNGQGNTITINSNQVTIKNISVTNWGDDLTEQNAGIYCDFGSKSLTIESNYISGDTFGIWLQKSTHGIVANNTIVGNTSLRSADRGNAIQLSGVKHMKVTRNKVSKVRDGLYVINSQNNVIDGNHMSELRYGIHYMYSYDNKVINNVAKNTRAGYALMSSRRLTVSNNKTTDSEDYGFLLNYITWSTISNNHIENVWTDPDNVALGREGKGLFVYNSGYNTISDNLVKKAEIGIHLTAGSENVKVFGNSFINNPVQVKYVSNRKQEWSQEGTGNYWSNYLGWDMDQDDKGDVAFEPNDGIDKLIWQYPEMKVLMDSPAVLILRWVQRQFPVLKPPGVKDSYPLMTSPHSPTLLANTMENSQ